MASQQDEARRRLAEGGDEMGLTLAQVQKLNVARLRSEDWIDETDPLKMDDDELALVMSFNAQMESRLPKKPTTQDVTNAMNDLLRENSTGKSSYLFGAEKKPTFMVPSNPFSNEAQKPTQSQVFGTTPQAIVPTLVEIAKRKKVDQAEIDRELEKYRTTGQSVLIDDLYDLYLSGKIK